MEQAGDTHSRVQPKCDDWSNKVHRGVVGDHLPARRVRQLYCLLAGDVEPSHAALYVHETQRGILVELAGDPHTGALAS